MAIIQAIGPIQEVLASGGAFSYPRLGRTGGSHRLEKVSARFEGDRRLDSDQAHHRVAVPGPNHLFPGFGAADQFRQLTLGIGHCNPHRLTAPGQRILNMDQCMVRAN